MGAAEGSIMAAIITTQTPTKNTNAPGSVFGPPSMASIRTAVTVQPTAARIPSTASSTMSARLVLTAIALTPRSSHRVWGHEPHGPGPPRARADLQADRRAPGAPHDRRPH